MSDHIDHCKAEIAKLQSWRGWLNLNRKLELAHYQNMLAVLLRAEQEYKLKRKGATYGKARAGARVARSGS